MLVFEAKLEGTDGQYERLDEAIRTARFVRNSCLKYWMNNRGVGKYELSASKSSSCQGVSLGK
jgi:putative transposase